MEGCNAVIAQMPSAALSAHPELLQLLQAACQRGFLPELLQVTCKAYDVLDASTYQSSGPHTHLAAGLA